MEDNHLTFEKFKVAAHDKVDAIALGYKNFGNTQEFQDLKDKIGEQPAEDIWETMQRVSYEDQYEHAMKMSYDDYLKGLFNLD
jgi:hypothetical protein